MGLATRRVGQDGPPEDPWMAAVERGAPVRLEPPGPEPAGLGRFGEFGGRFAPETLVPALQQLEREFRGAWHDDAFRAEYSSLLASYAGRPTPVTECHRLSERLGVRVLLEARGPHAHRLAQDQQRARPGAADTTHGQEPRHRRNRRRATRCRHRDRGRAVRSRVHGVHGRRRCRTPSAQRVADEVARRRRRHRAVGQRDAEGRGQRSDARVGRERGGHALLPRFGDGAASVSLDGARVPTRRRRRSAPAMPRGARRRRSRRRRRVCRRRVERDRHVRRLRRHQRPARRRGSRRPRPRIGAPRRGRRARRARRRARDAFAVPAGRVRPGARSDIDQRRTRLSGRRP